MHWRFYCSININTNHICYFWRTQQPIFMLRETKATHINIINHIIKDNAHLLVFILNHYPLRIKIKQVAFRINGPIINISISFQSFWLKHSFTKKQSKPRSNQKMKKTFIFSLTHYHHFLIFKHTQKLFSAKTNRESKLQ